MRVLRSVAVALALLTACVHPAYAQVTQAQVLSSFKVLTNVGDTVSLPYVQGMRVCEVVAQGGGTLTIQPQAAPYGGGYTAAPLVGASGSTSSITTSGNYIGSCGTGTVSFQATVTAATSGSFAVWIYAMPDYYMSAVAQPPTSPSACGSPCTVTQSVATSLKSAVTDSNGNSVTATSGSLQTELSTTTVYGLTATACTAVPGAPAAGHLHEVYNNAQAAQTVSLSFWQGDATCSVLSKRVYVVPNMPSAQSVTIDHQYANTLYYIASGTPAEAGFSASILP